MATFEAVDYPVNRGVDILHLENSITGFDPENPEVLHPNFLFPSTDEDYNHYTYTTGFDENSRGLGLGLYKNHPSDEVDKNQTVEMTWDQAADRHGPNIGSPVQEFADNGYANYGEIISITVTSNANDAFAAGVTRRYHVLGHGEVAYVTDGAPSPDRDGSVNDEIGAGPSTVWREVIIVREVVNDVTGELGGFALIFPNADAPKPLIDDNAPRNFGDDDNYSAYSSAYRQAVWSGNQDRIAETVRRETIHLWMNEGGYKLACFTEGTLIVTEQGERDVADLAVGDRVLTKDHGFQPIRWIGTSIVSVAAQLARPERRAIRIAAGALAPSVPSRDLLVSRQHRMLVKPASLGTSAPASEVLIAAKDLLGLEDVSVEAPTARVTYYHMLLDQHEVIYAHGAETESFYPGPMAMRMLSAQQRAAVQAILPELKEPDFAPESARPICAGRVARQVLNAKADRIAVRHAKAG